VLGQPELPPGASLTDAAGNHVVIGHEDGVYSCLAHLRPGSITVAAGQRLASGDVVGAVGTSGNTTGPHLHLHFMDGPDLLAAAPLPVHLTVGGETYAPVSGEIVGP
jgi:murein DD-endopeptidase MepM/ murein hydrolase activator NlpD